MLKPAMAMYSAINTVLAHDKFRMEDNLRSVIFSSRRFAHGYDGCHGSLRCVCLSDSTTKAQAQIPTTREMKGVD